MMSQEATDWIRFERFVPFKTQHLGFDTPVGSSLNTRSTSPAPERNTGVDEDLLSEGIQFVQDTGTQQLRGRMNSYADRRSVLAILFSMHRNIEPRCSG